MTRQPIVLLLFLFALLSLTGCLPKETPVPQFVSTANIDSVEMGSDYRQQVFYSLNQRRIVSKNAKTDWDLAFECGSNGTHILINGAKAMYVWPSNCRNMSAFQWSDTLARRWDAQTGILGASAMADWESPARQNTVYVVNRGLDANNRAAGSVLFQILLVDAVGYEILFKGVNESGSGHRMRILKNDDYNFTFLAFDGSTAGGKIVSIEPPKKDWDLMFTQYTHYFGEPHNLAYTVTGCLLNRFDTRAGRVSDTTRSFEQVDYTAASQSVLQDTINAIGYDWKNVDINTARYTVYAWKNFVISTNAGQLYKFHFIGFTNAAGANGMPKFEFQEL